MGLDHCAACLFAAALSPGDDPCPYRVVAPMAEGVNRVTYLAQALTGSGGLVALELHGPRDDVADVRARYRQWQPILDGIRDAGLARLLDVGATADGRLYVASDYVAGWPLSALRDHGIGLDDRRELARQVAAAIEAAHAAGVVHLRLIPAKIKISTAHGPRATVLGLGRSLIVDNAWGDPEVDRAALSNVLRLLDAEP
jgi:serine/threonine-protein kinase